MKSSAIILILASVCLLATGCQMSSKQQVLATSQSQVGLRSIQTRAFDTREKNKTLRTIIATLQDLGFIVDKADEVLGTVSATKLDGYQLRMTVTVRPRGETQILVRASAQYHPLGGGAATAVEDPQPYQDFFTALGKSMFLTAQSVE